MQAAAQMGRTQLQASQSQSQTGMETVPRRNMGQSTPVVNVPQLHTPLKTNQKEHQRFMRQMKAVQQANSVSSLQHTASKHRPLQAMWQTIQKWRPRVHDTVASNTTQMPMQDTAIHELESDVAHVIQAVGSRLLGTSEVASSEGMRQIVQRNLQWLHRSPDWVKLVSFCCMKRLKNQYFPPVSSSSTATSDTIMDTLLISPTQEVMSTSDLGSSPLLLLPNEEEGQDGNSPTDSCTEENAEIQFQTITESSLCTPPPTIPLEPMKPKSKRKRPPPKQSEDVSKRTHRSRPASPTPTSPEQECMDSDEKENEMVGDVESPHTLPPSSPEV
jgi:hypothetical protein